MYKQEPKALLAAVAVFSPLCELNPLLPKNKHPRYITSFMSDHSSRKLGIGCSGGMDGEVVKGMLFPRVNTSDM
jgi:hypothetical protein